MMLISSFLCGQAGDCPSVCITAGGNYTAVNGSVDTELSGVGGCLTAGEATSSYWIRVCFSSAGTFLMTITPGGGNNNDFDFAVWNGSNCPPTANPLRCSWAGIAPFGGAANKLTGIGNGAVDNSEGAAGNGWVAPINVANNQCLTIGINNYGNGSNNFAISFGGTATLTCPIVMPIELLTFTVENIDDENIINWVTASERDNDYFTIEHSVDGETWNTITKVDGSGDSTGGNMYEVIHSSYLDGFNYYRLSQTDYDGKTEVFQPIVIDNRVNLEEIYKIYNTMGQEVDLYYSGLKIIHYTNGKVKKKY